MTKKETPMQIVYNSTKQQTLEAARKSLADSIQRLNPDLVLFAGGSASQVGVGLDLDKVSSYVVDERFTRDKELNNSVLLRSNGILVPELVPDSNETLEEMASRMEDDLKKKIDPSSKVIAVLGVGSDGHIAGMNVSDSKEDFEKLFIEDKNKWVVGYKSNLVPANRITVRIPLLIDKVDLAIVYAVGQDKKQVVTELMNPTREIHEFPALVLNKMKQVKFFTDQMI